MTIRQRLSFSNILMIAIPVVLCVLFINVVMWNAMRFLEQAHFADNLQVIRLRNRAVTVPEDWDGGFESLLALVQEAERELPLGANVSVYKDGARLYPTDAGYTNRLVESGIAPEAFAGQTITIEQSVYHLQTAGDYAIVVSLEDINTEDFSSFRSYFQRTGFLMFAFVVAGICLTNAILTRIMFMHITNPIRILTAGVRELRDGNLDYRLQYKCCDEFKPVCDDFDEMAARLSDMVQARRMDEERRKELFAGISHDLRTPLTAIKAYVEGLEQNVAATEEARRRYLDTIKSKASSIEHILNRLFQYAKLDMDSFPVQIRAADAEAFASDYVEQFEEEFSRKGLRLVKAEGNGAAWIQADVDLLSHVFTNVLDNSMRYKTAAQGNMFITCEQSGAAVTITLRDDGPGVPPENLHKLFDVFYRGDMARNSDGSGLGLAISAKNIERMGGQMTAENAAGGGLVIKLRFPANEGGRRQ